MAGCFLFCCGGAHAQVYETQGVVRIEAENCTSTIARTINGVTYAWGADTATPGYSGTGYLDSAPDDGTVVTAHWTTTSAETDYTVNFTNPGTYYVWVRGLAGSETSASVYVGLNGASPAAASLAVAEFNTWAWANTAAGSSTRIAVTVPTAGTYTLNLWMQGAGFAVDRIVLTANPNYSPEYSADFWRNQNIYQIITDRFFDGDANNNSSGLPNYGPSNGGQAHGGDFKGIEQKLDYIKALGVTAIWISPVVKNANGDYHGYAATDFYSVNPRMGSLTDLQRLVREAQKRGILVINDVVANHGSTWVDSGDTGWATFKYPPVGYN
ncbi:MAG: hypothetical protein JHD00_13535, partial [Akkermansiaceae bacterium]|nr:hypothetical protein [Akkermansiaceae bacterium]